MMVRSLAQMQHQLGCCAKQVKNRRSANVCYGWKADISLPTYDQWMLSARAWFLRADRALDRAFASDVRAPVKASRSETQGPTVKASTHRSSGSRLLMVMSSTSCSLSRTLKVPTSPSISSGIAEG